MLALPAEWDTAVERVAGLLALRFGAERPVSLLKPHVTLCQPFPAATPADVEAAATAIGVVIKELPPSPIQVGEVASFDGVNGAHTFIHLRVEGEWLRSANRRLVAATLPWRERAAAQGSAVGHAAHDLAGYTPHITLVAAPRLEGSAHAEQLRRAAALWQAHRPAAPAFLPEWVWVSATPLAWWRGTLPLAEVQPRLVRFWRVPA